MATSNDSEMSPDQISSEQRRRFRRVPVLWSGRLDRGDDETRCRILNMSPAGAKLKVDDVEPWRRRVRLSSHHFGELTGHVVWREHDEVGIRFTDPPGAVLQAMGELFNPPSHAMV